MNLLLSTVKRGAVCAILFVMPLRSSLLPQAARQANMAGLGDNARVEVALDWFQKNHAWIDEQQIQLTEIPCALISGRKASCSDCDTLELGGIDGAQRQAGECDRRTTRGLR